jgi:hypothetical protein
MIKNREAEQNKKKVLEERKKKNEVEASPNKKIDSDEEPSPKEAAPQRVEKAVKIQVGENAQMDTDPTSFQENTPEGEEKYNPYMYDTRGPKKAIDYAKPEANQDEDDNLYSFDIDATMKAAFGEYSVKNSNEKFSLAGVP